MSCNNNSCSSPRLITNQIDMKWIASGSKVFPFISDQIAAISGYVLNNASSLGPVTIYFLRGGLGGLPLPFILTVQPGEYKSFTIVGADVIQVNPGGYFATGELNITINFNPF
jgi:hypothetical protein